MRTSRAELYTEDFLVLKNEVGSVEKEHDFPSTVKKSEIRSKLQRVPGLATVSKDISVPSRDNKSESYLRFRITLSQVSYGNAQRKQYVPG